MLGGSEREVQQRLSKETSECISSGMGAAFRLGDSESRVHFRQNEPCRDGFGALELEGIIVFISGLQKRLATATFRSLQTARPAILPCLYALCPHPTSDRGT